MVRPNCHLLALFFYLFRHSPYPLLPATMFLSLPDKSFDSKVTVMNIKVMVHGPMIASFFDPTAECKDDLLLVQLPLNRGLKSLMFLLSLASLPLATHVLWKYIHRGVYHCNIKVGLPLFFGKRDAVLGNPSCLFYECHTTVIGSSCGLCELSNVAVQ